jgi:alkylation response protein AidB-like acyl-CoA dehydrogenase
MEFDLSHQQSEVLSAVHTLLSRHAGPDHLQELGGDAPAYDVALDEALEVAGFGTIAAHTEGGPLDAALVVEEVARALGCVAFGARALVAVGLGVADLPRPFALVSATHRGPARFAADARTLLVVDPASDSGGVRAVGIEPGTYARVRSRFGYPFGDVVEAPSAGEVLGGVSARHALAWWQVSLALEMVGSMRAALDLTVHYVAERKQFGRAIGSFQVVQHRLADLTVMTEGARYLALEAAFQGAPEQSAAIALIHASTVARRLPAELHQMSGAIGFATEYPLHLSTMRLPALLAEARAMSSAERDLVALRWPGSTP